MVRLCISGVLVFALSFVACLQTQYDMSAAPAWNFVPSNESYAQAQEPKEQPKPKKPKPQEPAIKVQKPAPMNPPLPKIAQKAPKGIGEVVRIYYVNGELAWEIHFLDGKQHGLTKHFYSNGQLRGELNFTHGKANGELIQYYYYGAIKSEEQYQNDLLVGTSKFYTPLGELKKTIRYENGKQVEEREILARN